MRRANVNRPYYVFGNCANGSFQDLIVAGKPGLRSDPSQFCLLRNSERPLIDGLGAGDISKSEMLTDYTSRNGCECCLASISKSDLKALFIYLAKREGRSKWADDPAESIPLIEGDQISADSHAKAEITAQQLQDRLSGPSGASGPAETPPDRGSPPLPPFREVITEK